MQERLLWVKRMSEKRTLRQPVQAPVSRSLAEKEVGTEEADSRGCQELRTNLNEEMNKARNGHRVKRS